MGETPKRFCAGRAVYHAGGPLRRCGTQGVNLACGLVGVATRGCFPSFSDSGFQRRACFLVETFRRVWVRKRFPVSPVGGSGKRFCTQDTPKRFEAQTAARRAYPPASQFPGNVSPWIEWWKNVPASVECRDGETFRTRPTPKRLRVSFRRRPGRPKRGNVSPSVGFPRKHHFGVGIPGTFRRRRDREMPFPGNVSPWLRRGDPESARGRTGETFRNVSTCLRCKPVRKRFPVPPVRDRRDGETFHPPN